MPVSAKSTAMWLYGVCMSDLTSDVYICSISIGFGGGGGTTCLSKHLFDATSGVQKWHATSIAVIP